MSTKTISFPKRLLASAILGVFMFSGLGNAAIVDAFADTTEGHVMTEDEGAGKTIPDGDYYIVNELNQDYFLDIPGDDFGTYNGTKARFWVWDYNKLMPYSEGYDCFHVEYLNNGFYKISQMGTSKCLDSTGNSTALGASVQFYEDNGLDCQQWSIEKTSHGYKLRVRCSGFYLDVPNQTHASYTDAHCWEGFDIKGQSFSFIPRVTEEQPIEDGNYVITTNVNGIGSLTASDNNIQISGAQPQTIFTIQRDDDDDNDDAWYKIIHKDSGLVMQLADPIDDFLNTSGNIDLAEDAGDDEVMGKKQLWKIKENDDGTVFIINKASGYYLDLTDSKVTTGTNVANRMYTGEKNQKWVIGNIFYTIKYNANGGTGTIASQRKDVDVDLTLTTDKPTRTGYKFLGWNTSKTATSAKYKSGATYSENKSATLYAVWKANTYTVSYDMNGGPSTIENQTKTYGQDLILSTVVPERDGYIFLGWSTNKDAERAEYQPGDIYSENKALTLYAIWNKADIPVTSVTFENTAVTIKKGKSVTLTPVIAPDNATNKTLTWTSSNVKVATVTDAGVVKAISEGTATITAVFSNGITATCRVTVMERALENTSTVTSSVTVGEAVKIAASAKGGTAPYTYEYQYKKASVQNWSKINVDKTKVSASFKPGAAVPYNVKVVVTDANANVSEYYATVKVNPTALANTSTVTDSIKLGKPIKMNGSATGGTKPYTYSYYYKKSTASTWNKKLENTPFAFTTVTPGYLVNYDVKIIVKDDDGKTAEKIFTVKVEDSTAQLVNKSSIPSSVTVGSALNITGAAAGGTAPYTYSYYYKKSSANNWNTKAENTSETSVKFTPGYAVDYDVKVVVKDKDGKTSEKVMTCNVKEALVNTSAVTGASKVGDPIVMNASAKGGTAPYTYSYYYKKTTVENWNTLAENTTAATKKITPSAAANYNIKIVVKDAEGQTAEKTITTVFTN